MKEHPMVRSPNGWGKGKIMKKKNFVLILLMLSGIITAFTVVITNTINTRNMRDLAISSSNIVLPEALGPKEAEQPLSEIKEPTPTPEKTTTETKPEPVPTKSPEPKLTFSSPVNGEIITKFSNEILVFSEVFNDYRIHMGIDIIADNNSPVFAMADGVVTNNYFDYDEGIIIEIEHREGYVSVYKNLGNSVMAPVGKIVKQGETISSIGDTGVFESNMPYHLHLELKKGDDYIDPLSVIS